MQAGTGVQNQVQGIILYHADHLAILAQAVFGQKIQLETESVERAERSRLKLSGFHLLCAGIGQRVDNRIDQFRLRL